MRLKSKLNSILVWKLSWTRYTSDTSPEERPLLKLSETWPEAELDRPKLCLRFRRKLCLKSRLKLCLKSRLKLCLKSRLKLCLKPNLKLCLQGGLNLRKHRTEQSDESIESWKKKKKKFYIQLGWSRALINRAANRFNYLSRTCLATGVAEGTLRRSLSWRPLEQVGGQALPARPAIVPALPQLHPSRLEDFRFLVKWQLHRNVHSHLPPFVSPSGILAGFLVYTTPVRRTISSPVYSFLLRGYRHSFKKYYVRGEKNL